MLTGQEVNDYDYGREEDEFYEEPQLLDSGIYELEWDLNPLPKHSE